MTGSAGYTMKNLLSSAINIVEYPRDATELMLSDAKLVSLPESIGVLTSLTKLDLFECMSLVSLPERIGDLKALQTLNLAFCSKLVSLPERFGECKSLTSLNLYFCTSLVSLPDRFGECKSLTSLNLGQTPAGRNMPAALKAQLKNQGCSGDGW